MQPMDYKEMSDLALLQLCLWREARGEESDGKRGVAHVIVNRSLTPAWWNYHRAGILGNVILFPYQFSSFNPGDPNEKLWPEDDDTSFQECCSIASAVLSGSDPDLTGGAVNYFDISVSFPADWGSESQWVNTLNAGRFRFWKKAPLNNAPTVQDAATNEN